MSAMSDGGRRMVTKWAIFCLGLSVVPHLLLMLHLLWSGNFTFGTMFSDGSVCLVGFIVTAAALGELLFEAVIYGKWPTKYIVLITCCVVYALASGWTFCEASHSADVKPEAAVSAQEVTHGSRPGQGREEDAGAQKNPHAGSGTASKSDTKEKLVTERVSADDVSKICLGCWLAGVLLGVWVVYTVAKGQLT